MIKYLTSKVLAAVSLSALASAMLLAPLQASAGGTSLGHGVKCVWVVVSFDPATGTEVLQQVCTKGA